MVGCGLVHSNWSLYIRNMRPRRLGGLPRCPRNVHLSGTFDRKLTVIQLTVWWVSKRVGIKIACPYMHRKVTATGEIYNACVIPSMDCAKAGQTPPSSISLLRLTVIQLTGWCIE